MNVNDISWYAHPKFSGVHLKDLVSEDDTDKAMSRHLVRVDPGCELGMHRHDKSTELHQVLEGAGLCRLEGRDVAYFPGRIP